MKRKMIRALSVSLALMSALLSPNLLAADILTATPVTYMLATELTKGTDITTQYLPPKRYSLSRLPNWFSSKGAKFTAQAAAKAKVSITLSAVWPQEPLFVHAREGNIHMIEIDASQAISPRAQGVAALRLEDGSISPYTWLNPTNLTRMAAIVSQDLQQVWPQQAAIIARNQQTLMMSVRQLINQQQAMLLGNGIDTVVLLSRELEDFASGNQLFVLERFNKPALEWTAADKQRFAALLADEPDVWVLTAKRVSNELKALMPESTRILTIDSIDRWGRGINKHKPLQRWQLAL